MTAARRNGGALACCLALALGPAAYAQGISAGDYARLRPQAPRDVSVVVRDGAATVSWRPPPPPPKGRLAYDPAPSRYRVYRLDGGGERLVGETRALSFTDPTGRPGAATRYVVTTVQTSGREGVRSREAEARPGR